jgi:hypothetical protein
MGSTKNSVMVPCSCGRSIEVEITQAGTRVHCGCGAQVQVPNLSALRNLAGKHAYASNPAEVIKRTLADGINPAGESCLCCKSPSPIRFVLHAQCESPIVRNRSNQADSCLKVIAEMVSLLFLPRLLLILMTRNDPPYEEAEVAGYDVAVQFPLMVCERCVRSGQDPRRPSTAKKLMAKVPLYSELLAYYPDLHLSAR